MFVDIVKGIISHIKLDTLSLIEKKLEKSREHMGTGENILNRIPISYALRSSIDK